MFRPIRRKNKTLPEAEIISILESAGEGVLATIGEEGYPYAVPLNYVFHNNAIWFHCAMSGHKIDNLAFNPKVSFCVVTDARVIPDEFNTHFKSVVLFGTAHEASGAEKEEGLMALIRKFSPDHIPAGETYIKKAGDKTRVYKITIDHCSGKGTPEE